MDTPQFAEIVHLLELKGYGFRESTPRELRFKKRNGDDYCEITILNNPDSLPVKVDTNGHITTYDTISFEELKSLLQEKIN